MVGLWMFMVDISISIIKGGYRPTNIAGGTRL